MNDEEDTNPSANIPLWIERAVENAMGRSLKVIDDGCAAREARIMASETRVIDAINKLGVARLELTQKATESGLHALRIDFDDLRTRIEVLERAERSRPTMPSPPPPPPEGP